MRNFWLQAVLWFKNYALALEQDRQRHIRQSIAEDKASIAEWELYILQTGSLK